MSRTVVARAWFLVALALPLTALAARAQTPRIRLANLTVVEGNTGSAEAVLTLSLSAAATGPVTVSYASENVDATGGAACGGTTDYVLESGTVQINPGETSQPLGVGVVCGDTAVEVNETFRVRLSNPVGATIEDPTARVTITNDDAAAIPTLSVGDLTQIEGAVGGFIVSLSAPSSQPVTFTLTTSPLTAAQAISCGPNIDYTGGAFPLFISPGDLTVSVVLVICSDTVSEPDETFQAAISNPVNATLGDASGLGTITDVDAPQTPSSLSVNATTVTEGNAASVQAIVTVTLTPASSGVVTVNYESSPGSPAAAGGPACEVTGVDFVNPLGTLRFDPGDVSQTIPVAVCGDTADEPDEKFRVRLLDPVGATIATAQRVVTILDDDAPGPPPAPVRPPAPVIPTISVSDATIEEPDSGTALLFLTATLSSPSSEVVRFRGSLGSGTVTFGACARGDDIETSVGTIDLTIGPRQTSLSVPISICGDTVAEPDETFQILISNPSGAILGDSVGQGTITDNDGPIPPSIPLVPVLPTVSVNDVSLVEPDTGTAVLVFSPTLLPVSSQPVRFRAEIVSGTATIGACNQGADIETTSATTLTFRPGGSLLSLPIRICGDTVVEPDESFQLLLSNPSRAILGDTVVQGTITNDDPLPTLAITSSVAVDEPGTGGQATVGFTVTMSGSLTTSAVSVAFATVPGSARGASSCVATVDFVLRVGVLTFTPGTRTRQIQVPVCGDAFGRDVEASETFTATLSNPVNATITSGTGRATIRD